MSRLSARPSVFFAALLLGVLAACGGAAPEAKAPEGPSPVGTAAGTSKAWKDLSLSEKKSFMKTQVMPKMTGTFQSFDKKDFAEMSCVTCHGTGAKNGTFVMPNPELPHLTAADGFKKHRDEKPEITKFMMEHVLPDMLGLLGVAPYDPKMQRGFGCNGCHIIEH
jgi:hypothetical protein